MQQTQRFACRDVNCIKTFSAKSNERKHCRNKHPGLIGSSGIALNPQVTVHVASPIEEDPNYQLQPNEEPGFGFDVVNVNLKLNSESISRASITNHTTDNSRRFGFVTSTNTNCFCRKRQC
jgi:hypothetical protein